MGLINRYRMGALREKQITMQVRRQVLGAHPAYTKNEKTLKKSYKEIKKTFHKEAKYSGKLNHLQHLYVARQTVKQSRKADKSMSRTEAARIAAQARWHGGKGKKK